MVDLSVHAMAVLKAAQEHNLTIATAESCTAGCLATLLADAPGAGRQFHGGFVVYSKEAKSTILGVPPGLIAAHSAVSQPVAEAMATGILTRGPAQIGAAITGVAGPEPDDDGNPVGLIHIAVARAGGGIWHRRHMFGQRARDDLRAAAMKAALDLISQCLAGSNGT